MFVWENSNRFNFARDHFIFEGVITRKKYTNKHRKSIQASLTFSGDLNKNEKKKKKRRRLCSEKNILTNGTTYTKKKNHTQKVIIWREQGNFLFLRLNGFLENLLLPSEGRGGGGGGGGDRSRAV